MKGKCYTTEEKVPSIRGRYVQGQRGLHHRACVLRLAEYHVVPDVGALNAPSVSVYVRIGSTPKATPYDTEDDEGVRTGHSHLKVAIPVRDGRRERLRKFHCHRCRWVLERVVKGRPS